MLGVSDQTTDQDASAVSLSPSMRQIVKGSGATFIGSVTGLLLAFISRLLVARFGTQTEYGIYILALSILSLCGLVATLGLTSGLSRNIAAAQAKGQIWKARQFVFSSLAIVLASSVVLATVLFFSADFISSAFFHQPQLTQPLQIFAIAVPFFALFNLGLAVFQGFRRVTAMTFFQNFVFNVTLIAFLAVAFHLRIQFVSVFYAYLASLTFAVCCMTLFGKRTLTASLTRRPIHADTPFAQAAAYLIKFSLPLLAVAAFETIGSWIDTLMLGVLRSAAQVGLYNAALPLSLLVSTPLAAAAVMYIPVITALHAQNQLKTISRNLIITTKWICLATMPIAFTLFLFPNLVISLTFGSEYTAAAGALRILSLGLFLLTTSGLVMDTLLAFGHSRFLMGSTFLMLFVDLILDILLIPSLSIQGAAIADVGALTCWQLVNCVKLYSLSGLHPFSRNLLKPLAFVVGALAVVYYVSLSTVNAATLDILSGLSAGALRYITLPLFFVFFVVIYILAMFFTGSLDAEDLQLIAAIEKRTGVNLAPLKRIVQRFL
jgi:O-antigen/teichoic acid export membrane protein